MTSRLMRDIAHNASRFIDVYGRPSLNVTEGSCAFIFEEDA